MPMQAPTRTRTKARAFELIRYTATVDQWHRGRAGTGGSCRRYPDWPAAIRPSRSHDIAMASPSFDRLTRFIAISRSRHTLDAAFVGAGAGLLGHVPRLTRWSTTPLRPAASCRIRNVAARTRTYVI